MKTRYIYVRQGIYMYYVLCLPLVAVVEGSPKKGRGRVLLYICVCIYVYIYIYCFVFSWRRRRGVPEERPTTRITCVYTYVCTHILMNIPYSVLHTKYHLHKRTSSSAGGGGRSVPEERPGTCISCVHMCVCVCVCVHIYIP